MFSDSATAQHLYYNSIEFPLFVIPTQGGICIVIFMLTIASKLFRHPETSRILGQYERRTKNKNSQEEKPKGLQDNPSLQDNMATSLCFRTK